MASKAPFVVRWRNAVMDDPARSWKAKTAAMPLVRHADLDGRNCYPGAPRCADEMSVGLTTIKEGWAELKEAGYLDIKPLPRGRRRTQGALKVLKFPTTVATRPRSPGTHDIGRHTTPTYSGNEASPDGSAPSTDDLAGIETSQTEDVGSDENKPRACRKCGSPLSADGHCNPCAYFQRGCDHCDEAIRTRNAASAEARRAEAHA
jgi:hypothetical protein